MKHSHPGTLQELRALAVLLEERHVSRAAVRFHLTPRAREMRDELGLLLPRLENLIAGRGFDPATATGVMRIVGTDYTTATLGPYLLPRLYRAAPNLEIRIEPRDQNSYPDLERGRAELALSVQRPAAPLRWEQLFTDDLVCVADRDHHDQERFSLADYLEARHVVITLISQEQPMIERWLQNLGHSRTAALRVTFFSAAITATPGTPLVATVPRRLAEMQVTDPRLRLVEAPEEFDAFPYGMIWHPRLDTDPAHRWLREMIRAAAREMIASRP